MSQERLLKIILGPVITEKTQIMADKRRQIAFKVLPDATKPEIKKAVELLFNVTVSAVTVLNVKGKEKRFGRIMGRRVNWKKAYVSLPEGQDIKFTGVEAA